MHGEGATVVGPKVQDGTLLLVGGRRVVVTNDGQVKSQTKPSPQPLQEVLQVPSAKGNVLIARSSDALYRLDDPLGEPKFLTRTGSLRAIGAAPGAIAVWEYRSEKPFFIDLETGQPTGVFNLPPLPPRAMQFTDMRSGVAIFNGMGVAVTTDGGNTWKPAQDAGSDRIAVGAQLLIVRDGKIFASRYAGGPQAPVEIWGPRVGYPQKPEPVKSDVPLVKWVSITKQDPLELAAEAGVDAGGETAIVGMSGLLAKVDLKTGLIVAMNEYSSQQFMGTCVGARQGDQALMACPLGEKYERDDVWQPYGAFKLDPKDPKLTISKPLVVVSGEREVRSSGDGGMMLMEDCKGGGDRYDHDGREGGAACVLQPSGEFKTIGSKTDLYAHGAAPTAEGKIVVLRGLSPDEYDDDGKPPSDDQKRNTRFELIDSAGKSTPLGAIAFEGRDYLEMVGPVESDAKLGYHALVRSEDGVFSIHQPIDGAAKVTRLGRGESAHFHHGKGYVLSDEKLKVTTNFGADWNDVTVPKDIPLWESFYPNGWKSEVGFRIGNFIRFGWGEQAPFEAGGKAPEQPMAHAPDAPPAGREQALLCTTDGLATGSLAPLSGTYQVREALVAKPPVGGVRRDTQVWSSSRNGVLDTLAVLDEDGAPNAPANVTPAPKTWNLRWVNYGDVGAKVFSWSGAPPKEATFGTYIASMSASGGRALLNVRNNNKRYVVRINGAKMEAVEMQGYDLLPSGEVVFGTGPGEPIVWFNDAQLVVWLAGEAPRAIALIPSTTTRSLGVPGKDGVPVLLGPQDWAALRVIPIPGVDKKTKVVPKAEIVDLAGWKQSAFVRSQLQGLAACGKKPPAHRFMLTRWSGTASVDGNIENASNMIYDVRTDGTQTCVAGQSMLLSPKSGSSVPSPVAGAKAKTATPGPAAWLRGDLLANKFDAGNRGLPAVTEVRKMKCQLGNKP